MWHVGTSVLVLLGRTFLVGMSAQLVVCDRTSGAYHGGRLWVVARVVLVWIFFPSNQEEGVSREP